MLTEVCSVFEEKCVTHVPGPVRWSVVLAGFGFLVYVLSLLAEVNSKIWFSCASVVIFSKTATTAELTLTT